MEAAGYTVMYRGIEVKCDSVERVVEAVNALAPLEREVPVPQHASADAASEAPSPVAAAVQELFVREPAWRRPIEIVKALRRQRVPGTKYTTVYAALRYGAFVKREGRWNRKDAAA